MKTTLVKYLITGALMLNIAFLQAQEVQTKKGTLAIYFGFTSVGPARQMSELMKTYHFDETTENWLFGGATEHPHYDPVGYTGAISYSYPLTTKSELGLNARYAYLQEVAGSSEVGGLMFVQFSNFSLIPFYTFHINKIIDLQAGPALMINNGDKTSDYEESDDNYTRISPGAMAGIDFNIWNGKATTGKLEINYLLTVPQKMGPYSSKTYIELATIPESKIGFSYLSVTFGVGIHL